MSLTFFINNSQKKKAIRKQLKKYFLQLSLFDVYKIKRQNYTSISNRICSKFQQNKLIYLKFTKSKLFLKYLSKELVYCYGCQNFTIKITLKSNMFLLLKTTNLSFFITFKLFKSSVAVFLQYSTLIEKTIFQIFRMLVVFKFHSMY